MLVTLTCVGFINGNLALSKVSTNLIVSSYLSLEPRVAQDLSDAKARIRRRLHHTGDQVLEFLRVEALALRSFMLLPELI